MFGRMLLGALTRQKSKLAMIAITMALGVSLATALVSVMMDVGDKVNQELKTYGANLSVVPRGASILGDLYGVDEGSGVSDKYLAEDDLPKMKTIFWAFNIVDFAPYLETQATVEGASASAPCTIVGTWFDKHLDIPTGESVDTGVKRMKSWWDVDGSWADDDDPSSGMMGASLASKLGVSPGDKVVITAANGKTRELSVLGVFHSGGGEDETIFAPLAAAQSLSGKEGLVRRVEVSALTTPEN